MSDARAGRTETSILLSGKFNLDISQIGLYIAVV
jgi:hypothetical protein